MVDLELVDEAVQRLDLGELVEGQGDPVRPTPLDGCRLGRPRSNCSGTNRCENSVVWKTTRSIGVLADPVGDLPHGQVQVELAAAPVAAERVQVVLDARAQRVHHQVVDVEGVHSG